MKLNQILLVVVSTAAIFTSCSKNDINNTAATTTTTPTATVAKIAPDGFNYSTAKNVTVNITALTNDNKGMSGVPMNIYSLNADGTLGNMVFTGLTDDNGAFSAIVTVPAYSDTLVIDPAYIGLVRLAKAAINGNQINGKIGGTGGFSGDIVSTMSVGKNLSSGSHYQSMNQTFSLNSSFGYTSSTKTKFVYMGKYDALGRPL